MIKGREEEARKPFGRFYNKDYNSPEISAQIQDVSTRIEREAAAGATGSWTEINHKNDLGRTAISALIPIGLALTGIQSVPPTPRSS